ncbi:conserved hypothetical protein [Aspergillus terreus NIH2624]|uniref:Urea active transporter 1 n=1 Tax=Aspergillus terreus (strain NIH 2624 / FGSC A1156) TaxID=341663 RepID=Q0CG46_ASPTN|nr:uncharacterized protein ATEG_07346 [Aspergillus terreus NIH2624]EAU32730.1 conserved hypothetical protein [Aspergillus terreus NIH2624]
MLEARRNATIQPPLSQAVGFMTANRTVRTGLTASAVISSWLWTTAMLGSSFVGYDYGVAGPFWFAAGCSPMIVFFALLGISCKRKIPEAHTSLEVVRIRYGRVAHAVFMVLCLINNIFACANMLLGAAAVISSLRHQSNVGTTTEMPGEVVANVLTRFLTDYFHTTIILIIACYFSIKAFTFEGIGSIGNLYDLLNVAGQNHPVSGNKDGTYLTMTSKGGILFGILHICSNFGLVIMDTSYFIKAFSAAPSSVVPGYTIGGIAYFSIPWGLGTIMSSVALGLENQPAFPTYPRRMTSTEVSNGLVLPYAAITIAGKGGAAAILLITFMAVTSTLSAQVIAVSSILSFDVYREYFKKSASDRDIIRASHFGTWVGLCICWSKAAAILSPILGMATGIGVWLGTAQHFYGSVSVSTTGQILPCVYGTVGSALSPILYSVVITAIRPQNYNWDDFRKEKLALERLQSDLTTVQSRNPEDGRDGSQLEHGRPSFDPRELKRWGRIAAFWSVATFLGHWVLWPLPMYGSNYVFGKRVCFAGRSSIEIPANPS